MKKVLISTIVAIMLLCLNFSDVNATETTRTAKFFMNETKYEVEEGEEISVKLNLKAVDIAGAVSVFEYDKDLTLVNIVKTSEREAQEIYSPQLNNDGTISELEINGKKRFVFTVLINDKEEFEKDEDNFAELVIKVPSNVPKGKTYKIGWNKEPELTYVEDFKGSRELEKFEDGIITVVKSDYVPSTDADKEVENIINNKPTENKPTTNKDNTTANKNHVQAGSISSYICIALICIMIVLTVYVKKNKNI